MLILSLPHTVLDEGNGLISSWYWAYLMMVTVTSGTPRWICSLLPTRSRTMDENLLAVLITCGGCFSNTKLL